MTHAVHLRPEGREATTPRIPGKYLSLTSFRRDGSGVATPVWFVQAEGRLRVVIEASSYKVRRIRRDPRVTIAPCTATGRLQGTPVPAWAELLPDAELAPTERLIAGKYRVDLLFIKPLRTLQAALRRRPRAPRWCWRSRRRDRWPSGSRDADQDIRRSLVVRARASSSSSHVGADGRRCRPDLDKVDRQVAGQAVGDRLGDLAVSWVRIARSRKRRSRWSTPGRWCGFSTCCRP